MSYSNWDQFMERWRRFFNDADPDDPIPLPAHTPEPPIPMPPIADSTDSTGTLLD